MGAQPSAPLSEEARRIVVVVGVTGAGKSTTGNLMTGSRVFEESDGFESETAEARSSDAVRDGLPIRVIDTVGFLSTYDGDSDAEAKFAQFADMTPFGVDVFLLTEKFGRFTESNERHFKVFKEFAGPEALQHTILLFTHITNKQLQQMMLAGQLPTALQTIIGQVGAVVGVENKRNPRASASDLHKAISELIEANGGQRYLNTALVKARERREALQARIAALVDAQRRDVLTSLFRGLSNGSQRYEEVARAVSRAEALDREQPQPQTANSNTTTCWNSCTVAFRR